MEAVTRGGSNQARKFSWEISNNQITINSESGISHKYSMSEVSAALMWLKCKFGTNTFPLANNVERLGQGTEKDGLGLALYSIRKKTTFAQGSSYLGVVLEKLGVFQFDSEQSVISWRLTPDDDKLGNLIDKLTQ